MADLRIPNLEVRTVYRKGILRWLGSGEESEGALDQLQQALLGPALQVRVDDKSQSVTVACDSQDLCALPRPDDAEHVNRPDAAGADLVADALADADDVPAAVDAPADRLAHGAEVFDARAGPAIGALAGYAVVA